MCVGASWRRLSWPLVAVALLLLRRACAGPPPSFAPTASPTPAPTQPPAEGNVTTVFPTAHPTAAPTFAEGANDSTNYSSTTLAASNYSSTTSLAGGTTSEQPFSSSTSSYPYSNSTSEQPFSSSTASYPYSTSYPTSSYPYSNSTSEQPFSSSTASYPYSTSYPTSSYPYSSSTSEQPFSSSTTLYSYSTSFQPDGATVPLTSSSPEPPTAMAVVQVRTFELQLSLQDHVDAAVRFSFGDALTLSRTIRKSASTHFDPAVLFVHYSAEVSRPALNGETAAEQDKVEAELREQSGTTPLVRLQVSFDSAGIWRAEIWSFDATSLSDLVSRLTGWEVVGSVPSSILARIRAWGGQEVLAISSDGIASQLERTYLPAAEEALCSEEQPLREESVYGFELCEAQCASDSACGAFAFRAASSSNEVNCYLYAPPPSPPPAPVPAVGVRCWTRASAFLRSTSLTNQGTEMRSIEDVRWELALLLGEGDAEWSFESGRWQDCAAQDYGFSRTSDAYCRPFRTMRLRYEYTAEGGNKSRTFLDLRGDDVAAPRDLLSGGLGFAPTSLPAETWLALVPQLQLPTKCQEQGFAIVRGVGDASVACRLGFVGDASCGTPAGAVGIGCSPGQVGTSSQWPLPLAAGAFVASEAAAAVSSQKATAKLYTTRQSDYQLTVIRVIISYQIDSIVLVDSNGQSEVYHMSSGYRRLQYAAPSPPQPPRFENFSIPAGDYLRKITWTRPCAIAFETFQGLRARAACAGAPPASSSASAGTTTPAAPAAAVFEAAGKAQITRLSWDPYEGVVGIIEAPADEFDASRRSWMPQCAEGNAAEYLRNTCGLFEWSGALMQQAGCRALLDTAAPQTSEPSGGTVCLNALASYGWCAMPCSLTSRGRSVFQAIERNISTLESRGAVASECRNAEDFERKFCGMRSEAITLGCEKPAPRSVPPTTCVKLLEDWQRCMEPCNGTALHFRYFRRDLPTVFSGLLEESRVHCVECEEQHVASGACGKDPPQPWSAGCVDCGDVAQVCADVVEAGGPRAWSFIARFANVDANSFWTDAYTAQLRTLDPDGSLEMYVLSLNYTLSVKLTTAVATATSWAANVASSAGLPSDSVRVAADSSVSVVNVSASRRDPGQIVELMHTPPAGVAPAQVMIVVDFQTVVSRRTGDLRGLQRKDFVGLWNSAGMLPPASLVPMSMAEYSVEPGQPWTNPCSDPTLFLPDQATASGQCEGPLGSIDCEAQSHCHFDGGAEVCRCYERQACDARAWPWRSRSCGEELSPQHCWLPPDALLRGRCALEPWGPHGPARGAVLELAEKCCAPSSDGSLSLCNEGPPSLCQDHSQFVGSLLVDERRCDYGSADGAGITQKSCETAGCYWHGDRCECHDGKACELAGFSWRSPTCEDRLGDYSWLRGAEDCANIDEHTARYLGSLAMRCCKDRQSVCSRGQGADQAPNPCADAAAFAPDALVEGRCLTAALVSPDACEQAGCLPFLGDCRCEEPAACAAIGGQWYQETCGNMRAQLGAMPSATAPCDGHAKDAVIGLTPYCCGGSLSSSCGEVPLCRSGCPSLKERGHCGDSFRDICFDVEYPPEISNLTVADVCRLDCSQTEKPTSAPSLAPTSAPTLAPTQPPSPAESAELSFSVYVTLAKPSDLDLQTFIAKTAAVLDVDPKYMDVPHVVYKVHLGLQSSAGSGDFVSADRVQSDFLELYGLPATAELRVAVEQETPPARRLANTSSSDLYGSDPYGSDPYGSDPYASDPYGSDPYGSDPYASSDAGSMFEVFLGTENATLAERVVVEPDLLAQRLPVTVAMAPTTQVRVETRTSVPLHNATGQYLEAVESFIQDRFGGAEALQRRLGEELGTNVEVPVGDVAVSSNHVGPMPPTWVARAWHSCNATCGTGTEVREVHCLYQGFPADPSYCESNGTVAPLPERVCTGYAQCDFQFSCPLGRGYGTCTVQAAGVYGGGGVVIALCLCCFCMCCIRRCSKPTSGHHYLDNVADEVVEPGEAGRKQRAGKGVRHKVTWTIKRGNSGIIGAGGGGQEPTLLTGGRRADVKKPRVIWDVNEDIVEWSRRASFVAPDSQNQGEVEAEVADVEAGLPPCEGGCSATVEAPFLAAVAFPPIEACRSVDMELAYATGEDVEYYSHFNRMWFAGRILGARRPPGADGDGEGGSLLLFDVDMRRSRQTRHEVPMAELRAPLRRGEPCDYYSIKEDAWCPAVVLGPQSANPTARGYRVFLRSEEDGAAAAGGRMVTAPPTRLRRRFPAGSAVEVYEGSEIGWVPATVAEGPVEEEANDAAALLPTATAPRHGHHHSSSAAGERRGRQLNWNLFAPLRLGGSSAAKATPGDVDAEAVAAAATEEEAALPALPVAHAVVSSLGKKVMVPKALPKDAAVCAEEDQGQQMRLTLHGETRAPLRASGAELRRWLSVPIVCAPAADEAAAEAAAAATQGAGLGTTGTATAQRRVSSWRVRFSDEALRELRQQYAVLDRDAERHHEMERQETEAEVAAFDLGFYALGDQSAENNEGESLSNAVPTTLRDLGSTFGFW